MRNTDETTLLGFTADEHQEIAETVWKARREYEQDGMLRAFTYLARRHSDEALRKLIKGANQSTSSEAYVFAKVARQELSRREGSGGDIPDLTGPSLVMLSDVEPEHVEALWEGYIYLGKLKLMDGDPGLGKTTIDIDIGARVTTARSMPDGSRGLDEPASVVLLTVEDGLGDTIRPRLDAAGADSQRVIAITGIPDGSGNHDRPVVLPDDVYLIERVVLDHQAKLVIIDPLMAFLGVDTNSYRDQDVRRALAPLSQMAERSGAAVIVNRHLSKGGGAHAIYRGGGSIGIIGAARSGLMVVKDPDDETESRRIMVSTKNNLSAPPPAMAYRIDATPEGFSYIVWEGQTSHTANQLLAMAAEDNERGSGAPREEARQFLEELLATGPRPVKEILRAARDADIAEKTLRRAKDKLGVVKQREGFGEGGVWAWSLPDTPKMATSAHTWSSNNVAINEESGHLSTESRRIDSQRFCPRCEEYGVQNLIPMASMDTCHECARKLEGRAVS